MQEISHILEVVVVILVMMVHLCRHIMSLLRSLKGRRRKTKAKTPKRITTRKDSPARTTRKHAGTKKTQGRKKRKSPPQ